MTKVCSRCKEELEVSLFYKATTKTDGYNSVCKSCIKKRRIELKKSDTHAILSAITRLRKIENEILSKDGLSLCKARSCSNVVEIKYFYCKKCNSEMTKKQYEKNKEQRKEQFKEYIEKNKEKAKEYQKKYREKNKEKLKEYNKKYRERKKLENTTNNNQSV